MSEENIDVNTNKLVLKTIYELLGEQFYIPAYQRGYRWSKLQVRELLDDIWEFSQKEGDKASFYCLQPIVVVARVGQWELVDGQQRLTTLYIILHYLEKHHLRRELNEAYKKSLFSLEYETRKESKEFLDNIEQYQGKKNIDYHHIHEAYLEVKRWFEKFDYDEVDDFLKLLLAKATKSSSVQIIWYDLSDECKEQDYAIDVFSRINVGKIPLTNAELVKALFLQSSNFQPDRASLKQIQIASEWDAIEKSLQDPSFWYFIHNSEVKYETRIEYIFDLMKKKKAGDEPFFTFHEFNKEFRKSTNEARHEVIDRLWKKVKDYFLTLDGWYRDRELYHLIGFLIACEPTVRELKVHEPRISKYKVKSEDKTVTKTGFKEYLTKEISEEFSKSLDELRYGDKEVRKALLLFNIQTLLSTKEADIRFPFERYKKEDWDIEHIRSQTEKEITGKSRKDWSEDILEYYTNTRDPETVIEGEFSDDENDIIAKLRDVLRSEKIDDAAFKKLYEKVASEFEENKGESGDGLGNLALLDSTTNRSYQNAMFPVKRKRIIENDKNGKFVPICTKNAFLKFYSTKFGEVKYWRDTDANDYFEAIKHALEKYNLPKQETAK